MIYQCYMVQVNMDSEYSEEFSETNVWISIDKNKKYIINFIFQIINSFSQNWSSYIIDTYSFSSFLF